MRYLTDLAVAIVLVWFFCFALFQGWALMTDIANGYGCGGYDESDGYPGGKAIVLSWLKAVFHGDPVQATPAPPLDSRWKCPKCGSTHVQISLPTWYRETSDGSLTLVSTDGEADVQFWHCEKCEASDSGEPARA